MTTFAETMQLYPVIPDSMPGEDCPSLPGSFIEQNAGGLVSNLDAKETKSTRHLFTNYRAYSEQLCKEEIARVRETYEDFSSDRGLDLHYKLDDCRRSAWFARHRETGAVKLQSHSCRLRWCPMCAAAKQNYIEQSIAEWLKKTAYPKLLTLTILHEDIPLDEQVKNLYHYFQRLRARKAFKDRVTGGIWLFQIKISKADGLWHPHLHCLISGLSVSHKTIKRMWQDITYTSKIVDIRGIKDVEDVAQYVARYAAKPAMMVNMSMAERLELVSAMHGRRLCGTWGIAKGVSLKPPKSSDPNAWRNVGSWRAVLEMKDFNQEAKQIFAAWKKNEPLPPGVSLYSKELIGDEVYCTMENKPPPQDYLPNFFGEN